MRRHITTIATAILCIAAAAGQDMPDSAATRVYTLEGVEVSETATHRALKSTTPVYSLDARQIKAGGVTDIADAMRRLPGVNLRDYGGAGGLKTVSVRGLGAAHTAVTYDGVALSDCQNGQIDLSRYSMDNIEALSMAVGDNDDIFQPARATASAATLAISSTGYPDATSLRPAVTAMLKTGSFGLVSTAVRVAVRPDDRLAASVAGDFTHADNDYPFRLTNGTTASRERRNNSRINSGHAEANVSYTPTAASGTIDAKAYYYDSDRRLPGPVIYYNNDNAERLREHNVMGQLRYKNRIGAKWWIQGSAKLNGSSTRYRDIDGKYPGGELNQYYRQQEWYATGSVMYCPDEKWAVSYSADYIYNTLRSNLPTDIEPWRNSALQSLTARYRHGRLTVTGRGLWSIYLNSARRGESARDARRLSPSVSLSVAPLKDRELYLRLGYKNIFRMPTFNEAYFDHYGSATLNPESTDQFNAGISAALPAQSWLRGASVSVDGYINRVKDKIVAVPYNMFVWNMVNLGRVRAMGVDATVNAEVALGRCGSLLVAGSYSYQRAQPRTDPTSSDWKKQVAYTPLNSGSASLSWLNRWVNVALHATGASARYTTNNNLAATRISGYTEAGATVWRGFRLKTHEVEVRADIINMLDKQYCIVARYPMPGRSWQLTLKYKL